ncbi:MAG TPA: DinB family protein [Vicinamibacterales bacterium]|nr:DinB family protein [Vicinamibacterales bacterium]
MRLMIRSTTLAAALLTLSLPLGAQTREGLMGDLIRDIGQVERKVVGLAKALPDSAYDWRPGTGVRSTAETLKHIAADNYFLPALLDMPPPADSGITKEYATTTAFEKKAMSRDAIIAELEKSFAFLKASMTAVPDAKLDAPIEFFGQKNTNRGVWIMTTTHLHEHLGQLIAYARSNKVTPPWSK